MPFRRGVQHERQLAATRALHHLNPIASSPSESSTPLPPELPEAATAGDAAGAEAFVKHWVDVLNYAYQTGDTMPLRAISRDPCDVCESLIADISARDVAGEVLQDGLVTVDLVASPPPENGLVTVAGQIAQAPGTVVASDGTTTSLAGNDPKNVGFVAIYADSRWQLEGIGNV